MGSMCSARDSATNGWELRALWEPVGNPFLLLLSPVKPSHSICPSSELFDTVGGGGGTNWPPLHKTFDYYTCTCMGYYVGLKNFNPHHMIPFSAFLETLENN